jgi:hypothetical protein
MTHYPQAAPWSLAAVHLAGHASGGIEAGHEADRSGGDLAPLCAQGRAQFVAIAARRLDRDDRDGNAVAHYTARASNHLHPKFARLC